MAKKTLLLISIGIYQTARFVILTVSLVGILRMTSQVSLSGVALAVGGAAILPTLLVLQLILTQSSALVAPLRVALVLQLLGAVVTLGQMVRGLGSLVGPSIVVVGLTGILVLLDAASLVFLLSLQLQLDLRDTSDQPRIIKEEVEDQ